MSNAWGLSWSQSWGPSWGAAGLIVETVAGSGGGRLVTPSFDFKPLLKSLREQNAKTLRSRKRRQAENTLLLAGSFNRH